MIPALVVDALAAYRLTRLASADTILVGPRNQLVRWAYLHSDYPLSPADRHLLDLGDANAWAEQAMGDEADAPKLASLVTCRWCTGVWVAAGVVLARRFAPHQWQPVAEGLAIASAAALVAGLERD